MRTYIRLPPSPYFSGNEHGRWIDREHPCDVQGVARREHRQTTQGEGLGMSRQSGVCARLPLVKEHENYT
jgi:hypothetical protein